MIKRTNEACKYFPCHKGLEDCTFCYCPFYPCLDTKRGNYVHSQKLNKNIWSCQNCNWVHKKEVVDKIFCLVNKDKVIFDPRKKINNNKNIGIVIIAHGSKLKKANYLTYQIINAIKKKTGIKKVEPAYLQSFEPGLSKTVANLVNNGCKKIIIVPFFLLNGNHVTRDVPLAIQKEKEKFPKIKFVYAKNIGDDSRIIEIVLDRINEAETYGTKHRGA